MRSALRPRRFSRLVGAFVLVAGALLACDVVFSTRTILGCVPTSTDQTPYAIALASVGIFLAIVSALATAVVTLVLGVVASAALARPLVACWSLPAFASRAGAKSALGVAIVAVAVLVGFVVPIGPHVAALR